MSWYGVFFIWTFFINWQEFPIVSFNQFSTWNAMQQNVGKYSYRKMPSNNNNTTKLVSINLWNTVYGGEKIAFFHTRLPALSHSLLMSLPSSVCRARSSSTCMKYDKYVGLVQSEYWVHIQRFIATFWQAAQRNKANIMTAIKGKYCADHVYFITALISHPFLLKNANYI